MVVVVEVVEAVVLNHVEQAVEGVLLRAVQVVVVHVVDVEVAVLRHVEQVVEVVEGIADTCVQDVQVAVVVVLEHVQLVVLVVHQVA